MALAKKSRLEVCYRGHPRPKFSLKTGTIFEDSPLGLDKWLPALWLVVNCKNGVSSCESARDLGVTQKTAWFMNHRLRYALSEGGSGLLSGEVEVDETFIGAKARNMHKDVRARRITGTGGKDKTAVMGILERGGKIRTTVVPNRKKKALQAEVRKHVEAGSALYPRGTPKTGHTWTPENRPTRPAESGTVNCAGVTLRVHVSNVTKSEETASHRRWDGWLGWSVAQRIEESGAYSFADCREPISGLREYAVRPPGGWGRDAALKPAMGCPPTPAARNLPPQPKQEPLGGSACEPHREGVMKPANWRRVVNAMAIWQDLVDGHGFAGRTSCQREAAACGS